MFYYDHNDKDEDNDDVSDTDNNSNSSNRNTRSFICISMNNLDFIDLSNPVIIMEYENLIKGFLVTL